MNIPTPQPHAGVAAVERAASDLKEHFNSVRIFVTEDGDDPAGAQKSYSTGRGSFHAQIGQVREWLIQQDEHVREHTRRSLAAEAEGED